MTDAQCFPPLVPLLAGSGEESGRLPEMLDEAARRLSSSVEVRIDAMVRLFEPAVVLFMGGAVLLIVLAVLLPIFEMNQLVK
jgi:general secretion pathway protein F